MGSSPMTFLTLQRQLGRPRPAVAPYLGIDRHPAFAEATADETTDKSAGKAQNDNLPG
jgi:hypothetical protein